MLRPATSSSTVSMVCPTITLVLPAATVGVACSWFVFCGASSWSVVGVRRPQLVFLCRPAVSASVRIASIAGIPASALAWTLFARPLWAAFGQSSMLFVALLVAWATRIEVGKLVVICPRLPRRVLPVVILRSPGA